MATKSATVVVEHETGLHAHPALMFVQTASKFETDISMQKAGGETEVDARSSIAVLSFSIGPDEEIVIIADSNDGKQAVEQLVELVRNDFDLDTWTTARTRGRFDARRHSGRDG